MGAGVEVAPPERLRGIAVRRPVRWVAAGAFALPVVAVGALALAGGGYGVIARSQAGMAFWWVLLLAALAGARPLAGIGRAGWSATMLMGALTAWTGLALLWSESAERTVDELARLVAYTGALVLGLAVVRRGHARSIIAGLAAVTAAIAALALLSRLVPDAFPANAAATFLPVASRLSYPLSSWNGLAAMIAMGVPLVLAAASWLRSLQLQALAAAALPPMGLAMYFTISRGGLVALGIALVLFVALAHERLVHVVTLLAAGAATAGLIVAVGPRSALDQGLTSSLARHQGAIVLALTLLACAAMAFLRTGLAIALASARRPRLVLIPPRLRRDALIGAVAFVVAAGMVAGVPDRAARAWQRFQSPTLGVSANAQHLSGRLESLSGHGRYQWWQASVRAFEAHPLGTGPGTFELWWARTKPPARTLGYVRNAHSLYFETLAELGVVGLVLVVSLVVLALWVGVRRTVRAAGDRRAWLAAATAAAAAFSVAVALDWTWQLAAVALAYLLVIAVLVGPAAPSGKEAGLDERRLATRIVARVLGVAISLAALIALLIPLAGTVAVRRSQALAAVGRLDGALAAARTAERIEPFAATPRLQRALVLERLGDLRAASDAARSASAWQPTDWRPWVVRSRLAAERGEVQESIEAYRRARALGAPATLVGR